MNISKLNISDLEELKNKINKEIKNRKDYRRKYYEEHEKVEKLQAQLRYWKNKRK